MTTTNTLSGAMLETFHAISAAIDQLDAREPCDPAERIERWHHAKAISDALAVVLGQMASEAVDAMRQLGLTEAETSIGPVHTEPGYAKEQWDGAGVLSALAVEAALLGSGGGEVARVVPLDVLQDVLPAVSEGSTSSKWKSTGLVKHGVKVSRYRTKEDAPLVMRTGRSWQG